MSSKRGYFAIAQIAAFSLGVLLSIAVVLVMPMAQAIWHGSDLHDVTLDIKEAAETYYAERGCYPASLSKLVENNPQLKRKVSRFDKWVHLIWIDGRLVILRIGPEPPARGVFLCGTTGSCHWESL